MPRKEGQFFVEDFYTNTKGLNTSDSPFIVDKSSCTGGQNFDYLKRGGFQKRGGHLKLNSASDSQVRSLGFSLYDNPTAARAVIRAAGTKLQYFDYNAFTFLNLTEDALSTGRTVTITIASPAVFTLTAHNCSVGDTVFFTTTGSLPTGLSTSTTYYVSVVVDANNFQISTTVGGSSLGVTGTTTGTTTLVTPNTNFFSGSSLQPAVSTMFNKASNTGASWFAGAGATNLVGAVSTTQATFNGVSAPTWSSFTLSSSGTGGAFPAGNYYYSLVYRKASTGAFSNGSIDQAVAVVSGNTSVNLAWTLTNLDLVKYDKIYIYRSSVNGSPGFTAGALVAIVNANATSYNDTNAVLSSSELVPRANNTLLDNSPLPSGTYECVTLWKRRLVTASGSTVYISDVNKSEAWPTTNIFPIPSGGKITGLAVISITSYTGAPIDEVLCIFKQRELWIVTGTSYADWQLKAIDGSGCISQSLIASAHGYIFWINYQGVFMWNGMGKPIYVSQPIEDKFQRGGDIDKSKLYFAWAQFCQSRHEVQWYLTSKTYGEQKYVLKLDLRLTLGQVETSLNGTAVKGVFTPDILSFPVYAGLCFEQAQSALDESIYLGDGSGNVYNAYSSTGDVVNSDFTMQYLTPYLNLETPNVAKRFNKLVIWVMDNGVYNLQVDFWTDFRFSNPDASSDLSPVAANFQGIGLNWDIGIWDTSFWDTSANKPKALVYNLSSIKNNAEGDCIRFRFSQTGHLESPIIYGFSIYYTEIGMRK